MKFTKKCDSTQNKIRIRSKLDKRDRRRSSAGMFNTSSAGAVTSLILCVVLCGMFSVFTGANTYADYTISMTSSGAQEIDVLPSSNPSGIGTRISSDAVTVTTTCPSGYNLTTTTSVNNNKLYLNGSSSATSYFSASNGTTALSNAANTWGFYQNGNTEPTASSVFKAVPSSTSSAATIRTGSSSGTDSFNIYYGVAVDSSLAPGTYKMIQNNNNDDGTIVYYLTMASSCIKPYMQDVTESDLAELMPNTGDSATLYDKRDEQAYTIAKLADGKYWTVDNLNLGAVTLTTNLTSANTNISNTIEASTFNSWKKASGSSSSTSAELIPVDGTDSTSLTKYGTLYNYCAASAGTICATSSSEDATSDLCPAGWRMPTGGNNSGELYNLTTLYNTLAKMKAPLSSNGAAFSMAGYFQASTPVNYGTQSRYWTSTHSDSTKVYQLSVSSAVSYSAQNRYTGRSVRCVYQPPEPDPCEGHENELYCKVKAMSKGKQTVADIRVAIDDPDETETVSTNSGVYEYNDSTSVFGPASDAASTSKIYYYRGILDSYGHTGTYGSDGDNDAFPNTVALSSASSKSGLTTSDTCWRIVRTTGSGGVKMIYQGKWTAAGNSGNCKNSSSNANAVSDVYFNRRSTTPSTNQYDTKGRVIYVGYNYSSNTSHQEGTSSVANSDLFVNGTKSNLRTQLESWYNSNMAAWTSKLEGSAGWCNDRTTYSGKTTSTKTTSNIPYSISTAVYFGPYLRNATSNSQPTLGCTNDTGYDLLTTSNGYIGVPSAPITADEAALAGSGYDSSTTPYHANSYLRSGVGFWLLSPDYRNSLGNVIEFYLYSYGNLSNYYVSDAFGVRPSISLNPGTTAVSGTGTATDPWIVNPPNPYCTNWATCMQNTETPPACGTTMTDGRDGNTYTTATIGGKCWMTQNLRFNDTNLKVGESDVTSDITMSYGSLTSGDSYTEARIATGSTTDYGTYYNYCAASAGEVCSDSTQQDATRSVCPAGWTLPTQANLNAVPSKDSHFTATAGLAGLYSGGSLRYAGSYGRWWASTAGSTTAQYYLDYESNINLWSISRYYKYYGYSVRCVRSS